MSNLKSISSEGYCWQVTDWRKTFAISEQEKTDRRESTWWKASISSIWRNKSKSKDEMLLGKDSSTGKMQLMQHCQWPQKFWRFSKLESMVGFNMCNPAHQLLHKHSGEIATKAHQEPPMRKTIQPRRWDQRTGKPRCPPPRQQGPMVWKPVKCHEPFRSMKDIYIGSRGWSSNYSTDWEQKWRIQTQQRLCKISNTPAQSNVQWCARI